MLWGLIAVVTVLTMAAVVVPLLRAREGAPDRAAFDRAVYRDQLAEIARDIERGILTEGEGAAARLEVQRRLLATADTAPPARAATGVDPVTTVFLAASVAAGAVAVYLALGSPAVKDQPLASRAGGAQVAEADKGPSTELGASADRLAKKLKDNPGDGEGWLLLARTQAVLERWSDSAESYKRAMALLDKRPDALSGYGEMLVLSADGVVPQPAKEAFREALALEPENLPARYYLALADAQSGKPREAIEAWRKVEADTPADAPWLPSIRRRIEDAAKQAGIAAPPPLPKTELAANAAEPEPPKPAAAPERGPTESDMAAAAKMAPEERQAMIRGMVENLAQRLEQSPDDAAGWERLANAYRVLGENEKADDAAKRAAAAKGKPAATATTPRGPSAADVEAAGSLTDEQRTAMVRTMVASLAQRLEQNPDDAGGWLRLGRSYRVLGEPQKAEEALARAASLRPNDPEILLDQGRAMLDAEGGGHDPRRPLPPRFVEVMRKVEAIEPKQPEALWYLGLAEVQQQRPDAAAGYWKRLLAMLPPGSDDYKSVQQAVDALKVSQ